MLPLIVYRIPLDETGWVGLVYVVAVVLQGLLDRVAGVDGELMVTDRPQGG